MYCDYPRCCSMGLGSPSGSASHSVSCPVFLNSFLLHQSSVDVSDGLEQLTMVFWQQYWRNWVVSMSLTYSCRCPFEFYTKLIFQNKDLLKVVTFLRWSSRGTPFHATMVSTEVQQTPPAFHLTCFFIRLFSVFHLEFTINHLFSFQFL